jgi:hypothetical protein
LTVLIPAIGEKAYAVEERTWKLLKNGTRTVWTVWPEGPDVLVWRADGTGRTFRSEDTLDGGDVLPGFSVPVADTFALGEPEEEERGQS